MKNGKTTLNDLNESDEKFFAKEWTLNGDKIVSIHGRDTSTEEKYKNAPDSCVLVSVIKKKWGYLIGKQEQVWARLESVVDVEVRLHNA